MSRCLVAEAATKTARRSDALSKERIVAAAVEILDAGGEAELTVRGLTAHLATGRGAVYHHVSGKDDLLAAATDLVISEVTDGAGSDDEAGAAIRTLALGIFDAVDAHPWVGTELSRNPTQPAVLRIWTSVGVQLQRLGLEPDAIPAAGLALVGYVLGSTAQHVAGPRKATSEADRQAHLAKVADAWQAHDPQALATDAAAALVEHDDREQFLEGVDIFLAGIQHRRGPKDAP